MDGSEKNVIGKFKLPGGFGSFPGVREARSISGSLPDDPGGITCMLCVVLFCDVLDDNLVTGF